MRFFNKKIFVFLFIGWNGLLFAPVFSALAASGDANVGVTVDPYPSAVAAPAPVPAPIPAPAPSETPTPPPPAETPTTPPGAEPAPAPAPSETPSSPAEQFFSPIAEAIGETIGNAAAVVIAPIKKLLEQLPWGEKAEEIFTMAGQTLKGTANLVKKITFKSAEKISSSVKELRANETVVTETKEVVAPTVAAVGAVAGAMTAAIVSTSAFGAQIAYLISQSWWSLAQLSGLSALLSAFGLRRKRPWGRVYNFYDNEPISGAQVQLFKKEFDRLLETQLTDNDGRFSFLAYPSQVGSEQKEGEYYIQVGKPGFVFKKFIQLSSAVYYGQILKDSDLLAGRLNLEIPLVPSGEAPSAKHGWLTRAEAFLKMLYFVSQVLNPYLLAIGAIVSAMVYIVVPGLLNLAILVFYVALVALKVFFWRLTVKPYGLVLDRTTGQPLSLAVVRIYDQKRNIILGTKVTNDKGAFNFLLSPGNYYFTIVRAGYVPYQSDTVVCKKGSIVSFDVKIDKA